jgi:hypothetical protein
MSRLDDHLLKDVTARAATDQVFRKRLLGGGAAEAIYQEFGVRLPDGHRVRFIEKPADVDTLIVLPDHRLPGELDLDDLEQAAGGDGDPPPPPPPTW